MSSYKIQTCTGKLVDYLNPDPETICIEDIAKALSQETRFAGQGKWHYSVAQHSIMMCGLAPLELKLEFLMDDSEEAYIKDLPTPLQDAIGRGMVNQYRNIKKKFKKVIGAKFKLKNYDDMFISREHNFIGTIKEFVKIFDKRMAATERDMLFRNPLPLYEGENLVPFPMLLHPKTMIENEKRFLILFDMYRRDKEENPSLDIERSRDV